MSQMADRRRYGDPEKPWQNGTEDCAPKKSMVTIAPLNSVPYAKRHKSSQYQHLLGWGEQET